MKILRRGLWLLAMSLGMACTERQPMSPFFFHRVALSIRPAKTVAFVGDTVRAIALLVNGRDSVASLQARWKALDSGVVELDTSGLVTALAPGRGRIRATLGSSEATTTLTIFAQQSNSVSAENRLPGTTAWLTPRTRWANPADLAMWASPYSAGPRDTIDVYVHSTKGAVSLHLYRLGWYGGSGGRLVWHSDTVPARPQPDCHAYESDGPVACPWRLTSRIPVDSSWKDGLYFLVATAADGKSTHYPFVIHAARRATFTAIVPQFTWQAYNAWGGTSLYTLHGHAVSFERPYDSAAGATYVFQDLYSYDLSVIRWLEQNNIDVAYESDVDLQQAIGAPTPLKGLIFIGHSEYWTWSEYDRVQRLRDAHKHLMFLSGNNAYWNVRLGTGPITGRPAHVVICYKRDAEPSATGSPERTTRFRDAPLNRPENALYGIMYSDGTDAKYPLVAATPPQGSEAAEFMASAGIQPGDSIPNEVASEGDIPFPNGPKNLQVLFRSPFVPRYAADPYEHAFYTTFFISGSGAGVFAAGNNGFARDLSSIFSTPDARIQRLVGAVLRWMQLN